MKELRPNKKISMFRVTGLKILGRVGTHILLFWKNLTLDLQSDSHLLPDTLPTVLRGPVWKFFLFYAF